MEGNINRLMGLYQLNTFPEKILLESHTVVNKKMYSRLLHLLSTYDFALIELNNMELVDLSNNNRHWKYYM